MRSKPIFLRRCNWSVNRSPRQWPAPFCKSGQRWRLSKKPESNGCANSTMAITRGAEELIQQRLQLLAQAKPLTTDAAVVSAQSLLVKSVAQELVALPAILAEYDQQIAALFVAH